MGEVCAAEARSLSGNGLEIDRHLQALTSSVDFEDARAPGQVRQIDPDLTVEAPGPEEGRVEDIGPVSGRHHDDAGVGVKSVHLDQQLVERLLPLIVAGSDAGSSLVAPG